MKRKFIFLVMLFALLGGVNWNVLNAQEPGIKIGEDKQDASPTGMYPMYGSWYCSISQQIFTAAEIGVGAGNITSIAFKTSTEAKNHNITVWLLNTTNSTLDSPMAFGDSDKVFDGEWNSGAADTWSQITLDRAFSYNGDNLVVILQENGTGSTDKFYKYTKGAGTTLQYKYASYVASLEGLSGYYTSSYNNVFGLTIESAVDEGLIPGVPTNLAASVVDHASVSLTWDVAENAQSYNVYKNGVLFKNVKTNSCLVDGLNAETTYEFTVTALNFSRESDLSNVATATTPVAPKTRDVVFTLIDSYGDGWNGGTLSVTATDGTNEKLEFTTGKELERKLSIAIDATVTVVFNAGSYAYEASYRINYDSKDGDVIVVSETNGKVNNSTTFYFTVEGREPKLEASTAAIAFGEVRMGDYWTENNTVSETFNVVAKNTTVTGVTCDNTFFEVVYEAGVVTVSYDKTAKVSGDQTGTITIAAEGVSATVAVSATAYAPVTPDVIELAQDVEFTAGAYTNTPNFAKLHDDYNLPKEVNAGSTPDAVYHFTMENEGTLTVNVTGTNAIAAIYKAKDLEGSGPMANNNYKGIVAAPTGPTTFGPYDFEDGSLEQFTILDKDGDGFEWYITDYSIEGAWSLCSESYNNSGKLYPDNYIITNESYAITAESVLSYILNTNYYEYYDVILIIEGEEYVVSGEGIKSGGIVSRNIDLSAHAGSLAQIAFRHYNCSDGYRLLIDNLQLTDGGTRSRSLARSAEPQINGVQFPAGEYYLVAAAEEAFTVSIETASLPEPGEFAYTAPADGATEQNNPKLTWEAAQYATEYKVYLGTESTLTEEDLVATVTAPSYQTEGLSNNTQYFWKVDAVNAKGTKKGTVYSFVTPLDVPQNVTAANIFEGETVTLTWDAIENVTYNVYVDSEKVNAEPITATSYELTALAYNTSGYNVTVTAVHTLGESPKSAAVNVKVGGKFTFVLNVKDTEGNAIVGATVTFNTESFLNEFYQGIPAIEATTTDAEGKVSIELPLPCKYREPDWQFSSFGAIVTKEFYSENSAWVNSNTGVTNGEVLTQEVVLQLGKPATLTAANAQLLVGDDLELSWGTVAGTNGYNVYKQGEYNDETYSYDYVKLNDEMITDTAYTVEDVEYGMWVEYAVTAVYAIGESGYTTTTVSVTGMGSVSGTVTDGAKPVKGVKVVLTGKDAFYKDQTYTYTTDANGEFTGKVMVGSYTATATRYDFEDYTSNEQVVVNYNETASVNIAMTSYPSATINNVRATEADGNALVTWEAEYEKYNVYRRNVATDSIEKLATETTSKQYTDAQWASLDNGTYQYGVSTYVSGETRGSEILYQDDFESYGGMEVPTGWTIIGNANSKWFISANFKNSGDKSLWSNYLPQGEYYVVLPGQYNSSTTLSFYYRNAPYNGYTDKLRVCYSTSIDGPWTKLDAVYDNSSTTFAQAVVTFEEVQESSIYIAFCMESVYADGVYIDDVLITGAASAKESTITWSNELVKRGALTFNNAAGDYNWNNEANWVGGVLPTAEDNVVIADTANITGTVAVNNLTINARLNVMPEAAFTVNGTITDANVYGNLYIEDGAQIFQKNEGVNAYFRMNIINPEEWSSDNKAGWQFISSPLLRAEVTAAATQYDNAYQRKDYDMYKYNGSLENEWVNHKANYDFEAYFTEGRGYMYSHQARTIVTLGGTLNPATTFDYEVSYNGEENPLANLHLLGNPFTFNMDWSEVTVVNVYDGYATLNAAGDDYVYATSGTINVGDGFFVQATGSEPAMSYGMRGSKETSANINVIARGNAGEDNVIINFAGEGEGFRKLQGFNEDNARIFVEKEGRRYGIANVEANATEVELSFVAAQMGNYTISLDVNGKFETVVLVDRFTGVETNMLLEDEYSFTATSNDNPNRFVVRLGGAKTESASFVYQSGEELILSIEGSVQIVDMLGRVVYYNEHASGDNRINVADFNDATYVVRVVNEEGVKTQKVVIY